LAYREGEEPFPAVLGDLRHILSPAWANVVLVVTAFSCGAMVGLERQREHKPAGLRTLILICVGSAIFTLVSASPALGGHEPARIAAQIVTGVGFLGAGSILRERHQITGLTTAATIWATSGVGIVVGAGYAAAGVALSLCVLFTLYGVRRLEGVLAGGCSERHVRIVYAPDRGKTRARIQAVLDASRGPIRLGPEGATPEGLCTLDVVYCHVHYEHRGVLAPLADLAEVQAIEHLS
jgi:putative Mg2+ transporter-C (MgtC) family protein